VIANQSRDEEQKNVTDTSNFALRVPPEVKEAVNTMVGLSFFEKQQEGKACIRSFHAFNKNAAYNALIISGLESKRGPVDAELIKF